MPRLLSIASVQALEAQITSKMKHLKRCHQVLVGFPSDAPRYPDGTRVSEVAIYNEFGTATIPERSFLRKSVRENAAKYQAMFAVVATNILKGKDELAELGKIGLVASQDVVEQIDKTLTPPNAPYMIRQKGSSHPLIDTGHMRQQVTYKLKKRRHP